MTLTELLTECAERTWNRAILVTRGMVPAVPNEVETIVASCLALPALPPAGERDARERALVVEALQRGHFAGSHAFANDNLEAPIAGVFAAVNAAHPSAAPTAEPSENRWRAIEAAAKVLCDEWEAHELRGKLTPAQVTILAARGAATMDLRAALSVPSLTPPSPTIAASEMVAEALRTAAAVWTDAQAAAVLAALAPPLPSRTPETTGSGPCRTCGVSLRPSIPTPRESMDAGTFLWSLLDDIDTLDDSCRGDDATFRAAARALQQRRFEVATSDGYTLTWRKR